MNFDRYTHTSGRLRAMIVCPWHDRCRLDAFVTDYESTKHAAAFLFAWAQKGVAWPSRDDGLRHHKDKPDAALCNAVYEEQFVE